MPSMRTVAGCLLGALASVPLHIAALCAGMLFCVVTGLAPNGPWPEAKQNLFVISFGLWQWLYLLPLSIRLSRRWRAFALGLALSGIPIVLFSLLGALSLLFKS